MKPYSQDKRVTIYHGDCREILPSLSGGSAVVTDPPYELGFMGKPWDSRGVSFQRETWEVVRTACLSGAMLLSFGGTRTQHRIAYAIEDAGWEIRDTILWVYGSGFPKSLDISKAIDYGFCREQLTERLGRKPTKAELKAEWARFREVIGKPVNLHKGIAFNAERGYNPNNLVSPDQVVSTAPATPEAQLWEGYGTALKPAYEPIILAMNPLDGTFANNALKHGVAGLNIDECRVDGAKGNGVWGTSNAAINTDRKFNASPSMQEYRSQQHPKGRFPANFLHDGSQMVMELFPEARSSGIFNAQDHGIKPEGWSTNFGGKGTPATMYNDSGSAARFFYCAKASKAERDKGLEGMSSGMGHNRFDKCAICGGYLLQNPNRPSACKCDNPVREHNSVKGNFHPTVKPLALMGYLVKLVKMPEYNLILDPFCGSGTTLLACIKLGVPCIGIDSDEQSCEIAAKRCCQEVLELV